MPAAWISWWSSIRSSGRGAIGSLRSTASSCWAPCGSGLTSTPCVTTSPKLSDCRATGSRSRPDRTTASASRASARRPARRPSSCSAGPNGNHPDSAGRRTIGWLDSPARRPSGPRLTDTIGQRSMTDNEVVAGASAIQIQAELLAPIRRDPDRRRPRLHRRADPAIRPAAARTAAGPGGPVRRRRSRTSPRVSRRHGQDPQRPQLASGPAGAGPGGPSQPR